VKQLWLIAGSNGAGKSTFYERHLSNLQLPFINADEIAKEMEPTADRDYGAMREAERCRGELITRGDSFATETVMSHPSKLELIRMAQQQGYEVNLVFLYVDPELAQLRVQARVARGGHPVPVEKITARHPRTLANAREAVRLADYAWVYDNSEVEAVPKLVLEFEHGEVVRRVDELPRWAEAMLGE
jgi:predicted ABC-type ATPase